LPVSICHFSVRSGCAQSNDPGTKGNWQMENEMTAKLLPGCLIQCHWAVRADQSRATGRHDGFAFRRTRQSNHQHQTHNQDGMNQGAVIIRNARQPAGVAGDSRLDRPKNQGVWSDRFQSASRRHT
jgi:hypothetical protein